MQSIVKLTRLESDDDHRFDGNAQITLVIPMHNAFLSSRLTAALLSQEAE
jgi:hypothetical protein